MSRACAGADLEDAFRIICPDDGLLAMMGSFGDESGTHQAAPVLTFAMYITTAAPPLDRWARFRSDWNAKVLLKGKAPPLHQKELAGRIGHDPAVDARIAAAVEAIKEHTVIRVATAVDVAAFADYRTEYRTRLPKKFHDESAYLFCAVDCLRQVTIWMDEIKAATGYDDQIVYAYEDGHNNAGGLRVFFEKSKADPELRRLLRLWTFFPATKKERPELQAADLFAYWIREFAEAVDYRKEAFIGPAAIVDLLSAKVHRYNYYDRERLSRYLNAIDGAYKIEKAKQDEYERLRLFERKKQAE
jgi:hypothetical protein